MTQAHTHDTLLCLAAIIESRKGGDPETSYVSRLFHKGDDAVLKKIGEEATPHLNAIARTGSGALLIVGERGSAFQSRDDGATAVMAPSTASPTGRSTPQPTTSSTSARSGKSPVTKRRSSTQ